MTDAKLQALMNRCARAAEKHHALLSELEKAVRQRYGTHYSDVDCDGAIDTFDQQGGDMSVAELDEQMAMCGAPKLEGK